MNILSIPSKLHRLYNDIQVFLSNYERERLRRLQFEEFYDLQMESAILHQNTFSKYRNCNKGKSVAVIGSGPTLDKWRAPEGCIQIGVNGTFVAPNVALDYWFIQDYVKTMIDQFDEKNNKDCEKFFGIHYMLPNVKVIPFVEVDNKGANQYYFYDCPSHPFPYDFTIDISSKPFITYGSTIFVALQFALYTHPDKIYIVGCDCSSGHFGAHKVKLHNSDVQFIDVILDGWKKFAIFAKALYPDVEIISVNPVGLKGLFKDEYID